MVNEKTQEGVSFPFPYYAYADKTFTIPPLSESYLTLTFSANIAWHNLMITALVQTYSCFVNIQAISNSTARIRIWSYAGSSLTTIVRVMALLPNNVTMTIT